jgi:hypothetical protein
MNALESLEKEVADQNADTKMIIITGMDQILNVGLRV